MEKMFDNTTPEKAGISCIPPEILSEIFVRCLPTDSTSQDTQKLLSSICRLWRELALATPALWASLDIRCNTDALRPPLPVIRTHLQRSGARPLSIILHAAKYSDNVSLHLLAVLAALAAARQRWCNVSIVLPRMTQDILDLLTLGDAPLLQSMRCNVVQPQQRIPTPLCALLGYPRLESFEWHSFGAPLLLPLGETQLTSLSLRANLSVSECITLLQLSPRLSSAAFYNITPDSPTPDSPTNPHLTHSALCTLNVVGEHSTALLAALALPSLLNLDLMSGVPLSGEWDTTLTSFLERTPLVCQLSLCMSHTQGLEPAVLRILALTPHLRSLSLSECLPDPAPYSVAIIHALHPPPSPSAPLCPRLQRLELSGISDCPDGLCGAMLRARWGAQAHPNGVTCLEWAKIDLRGGVHERDQADIAELCAEGMQGKLRLRN